MSKLFTETAPYRPLGMDLGGGWRTFETKHGIDGLYREKGYELELLAVHAGQQGTGQFRSFVAAAKDKYDAIFVWAVANPFLPGVLKRYGFVEAKAVEPDGEELTGFRWDRE